MKTKALLWTVVLVILVAAIAGAVWWELQPQVITLDDGSKMTLLGVSYGQHHKAPVIKTAKGVIRGRTITTTNDILVLWVRQQSDPGEWHNFIYYLFDRANTACVYQSGMTAGGRNGDQIVGVQFTAFPRRDSNFYVRGQENSNGGQEMSDQKFVISNPVHGPFPTWAPQPLPDTEQDGNFSATLKKLVAQVTMPNGDDDDPSSQSVEATFQTQLNGTNTTDWMPVSVATSDATGNTNGGWTNPRMDGDDIVLSYRYALWPDEAAWNVRVEFSRTANFSDNELWAVPGIPLQPARLQSFWNRGQREALNNVFAQADMENFHLSVSPAKQFTDAGPNANPQGALEVEVDPAPPEGWRLTLVKLNDDQGNDVRFWDYGHAKAPKGWVYRYGLQNIDGVTNLTAAFAFHKSHFVEFTVKPEKQNPASDSDQSNQQ